MTHTLYKVGSAVASGAMLLASLGPIASASTNVTITGNGAFSDNTATVSQTANTAVSQSNTFNADNNVHSTASTGGNTAFGNTGGDVTISTGNAATATKISNTANQNIANVENCGGCAGGNTALKIAGNGVASSSDIDLTNTKDTTLTQNNVAYIDNDVYADAKTGANDASLNTGGDVIIKTGSAKTWVDIDNTANKNVATIGSGGNGGGSLTVDVKGNGAFSDNNVDADFTTYTTLAQNNFADIENDIDANALTGYNSAFGNTGGDTGIGTGAASVGVTVDNTANFNWANLSNDCCIGDVAVDVSGNGAGSTDGHRDFVFGSASNDVTLNLANNRAVAQNNDFDCDGGLRIFEWDHQKDDSCSDVHANAKTGANDVSLSTGSVHGNDPLVLTGSAANEVVIGNTGNSNVFGNGGSLPSPFPTSASSSSSNLSWIWGWLNWTSSM